MKKETISPGLFSGIMLAYGIVLLHILLIAGLGMLIIFFKGITAYLPLVLASGLIAIGSTTWYLFRRLRSQSKGLHEVLNSPLFKGKSVEIKLLGGVASIRIDLNNTAATLPITGAENPTPLLEDRNPERIRELVNLARSLENDPITQKGNDKTGRNFFN